MAADAGAPPALLSLALWLAAGAAVLGAAFRGPATRWLDGWRAVLALALLSYLPDVYGRIGGDGFEYYALARSALFDRDLEMANDYQGLGAQLVVSRDGGEVVNRVPMGTAVLWTPAILLAHAGTTVASWLGSGIPADGFSPPYQSAATTATYVLGAIALVLIEGLLRRWHAPPVALLSILGIWLATPLHFYMVVNPAMSHGAAVFAATAFVVLWLRARRSDDWRPWVLAGVAGALSCAVRIQEGVLLALPLADLALDRRKGRARLLAAFLAGPALVAALQALVWARLWGPGFLMRVAADNDSPGFGFEIHVVDLLLSPRHGLFTWTPLYLAAVAGWVLWLRREGRLAVLCLLAFGLAVLLNGSMGDWWGSDGFGQRRLLGLTPLFALGLAACVEFLRQRPLGVIAAVLAALVLWNQQLAYIYNAQLVAPRDQAITLDRLAPAQAEVLYQSLLEWSGLLPARLWRIAYDNVKGVWVDGGPRSLKGRVELGDEPSDLPFLVGPGWYPPRADGDATFRESRGEHSTLRVPLRDPADFRVTFRARSGVAELPVAVTLEVNGAPAGSFRTTGDWADYSLVVRAEALRPGINTLVLGYSATPRSALPGYAGRNAAIAVDGLRFERADADP